VTNFLSESRKEHINDPVVNFKNILRAAFALIYFCQKIILPIYNKREGAQKAFVQKVVCKMLANLTPADFDQHLADHVLLECSDGQADLWIRHRKA